MEIKLNNFTIVCDKEINYIEEIIETLENKTASILSFFELDKLEKNKKIIIYTDRKKYKQHILQYEKEFKDWMCADTFDGNINLLEITEARKTQEHNDMTITEFTKVILHEFVHAAQQVINQNSKDVVWYWEALATNLSGQKYNIINLSNCDFNSLQKDFNNTEKAYNYSFTLGKFMLENYPKSKLLEYVRNKDLLKKEALNIFYKAKQSQTKKQVK